MCFSICFRICYDWGRLCTPEELLPSPGHLLLTDTDHLRFLLRTKDFVNPLQYSKELTVHEARRWLQTEKLRKFPRIAFLNRGSDACNLIESGLVWSAGTAALFPGSCRRRAREITLIRWQDKRLPHKIVAAHFLPFVIDRWEWESIHF